MKFVNRYLKMSFEKYIVKEECFYINYSKRMDNIIDLADYVLKKYYTANFLDLHTFLKIIIM